jgi:hypothetical protein
MSFTFTELLVYVVLFGSFAIVFGYILVRAMTIAHYRSRTEYDRQRDWDKRGDNDNGKV